MNAFEVNFDGIVGPTHNYAGLSYGNLASMKHKLSVSNPRAAALQGLEKIKFLFDLGVNQAVLPPHERPHLPTLRRLGFSGSDGEALAAAARTDPALLARVSSSSAMWTANAATVSPSSDSGDGRVHFTPANLVSTFHRSIESATTRAVLKQIFADERYFVCHHPLPAGISFSDEGAANHTRLWSGSDVAVQIFTYGRQGDEQSSQTRFPARQSLLASEAIARLHEVRSAMFVKQNPRAIDAGAFHNDVVAVGHRDVLFLHELAWESQAEVLRTLQDALPEVRVIQVRDDELPLPDAIKTYLFNSQLVDLPDGSIALIAPLECRDHPAVQRVMERIVGLDKPIAVVHYVDVRQSMRNGGGPACLRLRVMLTDAELAAMHQGVIFSTALYQSLKSWINKHYREKLTIDDLADSKLVDECRVALDELSQLLSLPGIYSFQK
jgi:succinylarginine dihydrolase